MEPKRHFNYERRESAADSVRRSMPKPMRMGFAIFMALIFIFAGLMLLFNWFNVIYDPDWNWLRWVGGPIFILYGLFRGIRLYRSTGSNE